MNTILRLIHEIKYVVSQFVAKESLSGRSTVKRRVLYVGHCYYNNWYISRELRKLGWKADTLNTSTNPTEELYFHGEDFKFRYSNVWDSFRHICFFLWALRSYDVFHFYGIFNMIHRSVEHL